MRRTGRLGLLAVCVAAPVTPAAADGPITDRDYAIDFYEGIAIGNTSQVGMGGAGAALVVGSAGNLLNASAPAVRLSTDTDGWNWDYHFDVLTGKYSTDYDNNGIVIDPSDQNSAGASLFTVGIGGRFHDWAAAVTIEAQTAPIAPRTAGEQTALTADALRTKIVLAKWIPQLDLAVGIGVQPVTFQVVEIGGPNLFRISGAGAVAGATWVPRMQDFRVAAGVESAINGGQVDSTCDPLNCRGYILPDHVEVPARMIVGGAYRLAETRWNQLVGGGYRDEPSLTVAADLVITGASPNGYGIEAFGLQRLQRSGEHVAVSVRGGAEYEWLPGRLRVRAGSYWEPRRFERLAGFGSTAGRIHATFGADVRVFEFQLWGRRRGRFGITADLASRYKNVALSLGFWH